MNHADLDSLFTEALHRARRFLEKTGYFPLFGLVLQSDGHRRYVEGWTRSEPAPAEAMGLLHGDLREALRQGMSSGEYRATALVRYAHVRDERAAEPTDAVCVTLETEDGESFNCYLSCSRGQPGHVPREEVFADSTEGATFVSEWSQSRRVLQLGGLVTNTTRALVELEDNLTPAEQQRVRQVVERAERACNQADIKELEDSLREMEEAAGIVGRAILRRDES